MTVYSYSFSPQDRRQKMGVYEMLFGLVVLLAIILAIKSGMGA